MKHIGPLFKQIDERLSRSANNDLRAVDATLSQLEVLIVLAEAGPAGVSLRQIEARLGTSQPTIAGLVHRLEAKGFASVAVDENDRRYRRICITDAGRRVMESASEQRGRHEDILLAGFSDEERTQLEGYLSRVLDNLQKADVGS